MEKTKKRRLQLLAASVFWLGVWQAAAMAIGQEVFLVSPAQALGTLVQLLPQAELKIETTPAVTYCADCAREYPTVRYGRTCPHCGGEKTWLVRGNEINIKEIEAL